MKRQRQLIFTALALLGMAGGGLFALNRSGFEETNRFSPAATGRDIVTTVSNVEANDTLPGTKAPEKTFTGNVYISGYFRRPAPSRLVGATATFTPGSRTPWKVNPFGQTLIVTSGVGWAQSAGEEIVEIRVGDIIWCPPGQRHWEGATPDQAMSYVAIQEEENGRAVEFIEKVTDGEYRKGPGSSSR